MWCDIVYMQCGILYMYMYMYLDTEFSGHDILNLAEGEGVKRPSPGFLLAHHPGLE